MTSIYKGEDGVRINLYPRWRLAGTFLGVALILVGCDPGDTEAAQCISDLPPAGCTPLYAPVYDEVFAQTLAPKCAVAGGACHAATGAKGGLILEDVDDAYTHLLDPPSGAPRVVPNDVECSLLVRRLFAEAPASVMPPGSPLGSAERCAVITWIRDGAAR